MLKKSLILPALVASLQAEVTPVNIVLHDSNTSYSVPSGKTLIIEHFIWALEGDATAQTVNVRPANKPGGVGDFLLKFSTEEPDSWTPPRPIRLVGGSGASVSIIKSDFADWRNVMISGLLVDNEDLYAANIKSKLINPRTEGGKLMADVKYDSPRPRITTVESSDDLTGFSKDATASVSPTNSKTVDVAAVNEEGSDKKFVRVVAKARSKE